MTKREVTIYLYLSILAVAFIGVCGAMFLMGNKPELIKAKLKVGATIIMLNAMLSGCDAFGGGAVSCYDVSVVDPDQVSLEMPSDDTIYLDDSSTIEGQIENCQLSEMSVAIYDEEGEVVQAENVEASDGAFNGYNEEFTIDLDPDLEAGIYILELFPGDITVAENGTIPALSSYTFEIVRSGEDTESSN